MDEKLAKQVRKLTDEAEIRDVLARYCRAVDRIDYELVRSLIHPDADIDFGPDFFEGKGVDFGPAILGFASTMKRTQHMLGVTVIELDGDVALCESYCQAMHIMDHEGTLVEFATGHRYLDRMERRADGVWRIARRQVVADWLRRTVADESLFTAFRGPPQSARGKDDLLHAFLSGARPR